MSKLALHHPGYENQKENTYYIVTTECENCDACIDVEVPKKVRAAEHISKLSCPVCECVGTLKRYKT